MKTKKRKLFEKATWTYDLTNPLADKNCLSCNGYGICEDGRYSIIGFVPINCPDCHNKK